MTIEICYLSQINKQKPALIIIFFALIYSFSWGQETEPQICNDQSVILETVVTGDFVQLLSGGANKHKEFVYLGMENIILSFNTEACGLWKGGTLTLHGLNTHGPAPSADFVNDMQVFDNIEAGDHTGFYEFNYRQRFGPLSLMIGQHDLNVEFCGSEHAGLFINSSFGITPSIALNIPVAIFPVAAPCFYISYQPDDKCTIRTAVYDGVPGDIETNKYNLDFKLDAHEGLLSIAEFECNSYKNTGNKYKAGLYFHSSEFVSYKDTTTITRGNFGFYATIDKKITEPTGGFDNGLNVFLQTGFAPADRNLVTYYIGMGFSFHGFFRKLSHDQMGIGMAHVGISKDYAKIHPETLKNETAIEITYQMFIGEKYSIQPDLQYIIHPGAVSGIKNALAGSLRLSLSF